MIRIRLGSIRRQLVLWYLSLLAIVLLGLGIFQYFTLSQYLRSTIGASLRHSASAQLHALGPCFILSAAALNLNAQSLAGLLGSHDTAVKIVTPSGETVANHGFGFAGHARPLNLSPDTIHQLISSTRSGTPRLASPHPSCESGPPPRPTPHHRHHPALPQEPPVVSQGNMVLVAVPLGPPSRPVGYALLGQSFADANATLRRSAVVFALGALMAVLLAALIALPLIDRALRPLRRIARTAGAIAEGDLQRRANLSHSSDEVGQLGMAFDTMVDRLQAALTASSESEERMRRFLADASHELRTPLTVLRGSSEVLLRQDARERPDIAAALQGMHEEAVRLSRLVDDLLTLTRLDAGQTLLPEMVPVRPFLEQFADRYAPAWPNRQLELQLGALDGAAALVDPEALRRVLTNLIDNAARYSTPGQPITVSGAAQQDRIALSISDAGPGLGPEDAARVFERFYRGARSRSRHTGGSGLGLAIVQALVSQSGGEVAIETDVTRGTTARVTLPRSL